MFLDSRTKISNSNIKQLKKNTTIQSHQRRSSFHDAFRKSTTKPSTYLPGYFFDSACTWKFQRTPGSSTLTQRPWTRPVNESR